MDFNLVIHLLLQEKSSFAFKLIERITFSFTRLSSLNISSWIGLISLVYTFVLLAYLNDTLSIDELQFHVFDDWSY